jgi:MraZ protein
MFLGEFQHSLDAKGRVILPAKFREQLTDGAIITKGRGRCLAVYTAEEFEQVANTVSELAKRGARERDAARVFFSGANDVQLDRQGRVAIPQALRAYAGLEREVSVVGVYSRIEIWDTGAWHELDEAGDAALRESDDLHDFGI